ncbi:MAG: calcium/sodium antiporter [Aquisalinus sp.]|nr:calcium/sodium antiporter [Aquisalinus sp.]
MLTNIILIIFGLGLLIVGGDLLVRGAVSLASRLNIPTLLISLTIVAFGTSAPEFVVTLQDVLTGDATSNGIAMGNIIGSNIANVLLVLGLPAILYPIAMNLPGCKRHATVMLLASVLFAYFVYVPGAIDTTAGIALMGSIFLYIVYIGWRATQPGGEEEPVLEDLDEFTEDDAFWKTPAFLIAGLIGLPLGAKLLVDNGSAVASELGVREEVIGLTIVAFGTSLPELATVVAAALKRQAEVAVGNIVGSNIFNLLFVGGTAGLAGTSYFTDAARSIDMPVMLASTAVLAVLIFGGIRLNRFMGIGMFIAYAGYIIFIGSKSALI